MSQINSTSVTIANGAALSNAVKLSGATLLGIEMPAAWTAAGLTFQHSIDGVTYTDLYDGAGAEVSLTVVAAHYVFLPPANWSGIVYLKVRSGTGGTPVNQGAERVLKLVCKEL
jgi:hypothetical protein